jgi:PAS domain S-box-containing protein
MIHDEPQTLLLVEDNPGDARLIREALTAASPAQFTCVQVERMSDALARLEEESFAIILLDLSLPDSHGFDTIRQVQAGAPEVPIVVLTGTDDEELALKAVQEGAQDYLVKGVEPRTLIWALRHAIERQRLRQQLRASEERYRNLFENASDAIVSFTPVGEIIDVNRGLETMLGWARDELIEQHYSKIVTPTSAVMMEERVRRALTGESSSALRNSVELEAVCKDSNVVPIEIRDDVFRNPQGQPIGILVMARDISARKALERQRTEFLAMLTHDIKNPLTSLMGYTDYLLERTGKLDSAKRDEVLPWIKSNAFTILSLVNNYLDLSRIEDQRLNLNKEPLNVNDLLNRVGRQYAGEARHRQITLEFQLQKKPPRVEGDPLALERIFANLIYNALKFTPKQGYVTVSSASRPGEAVVTIADTGSGILSKEIPLLFGKYQRAVGARRKDGTGLGLFIVKTLVEAHKGRIEVESEPGSGTRFHIFLPLKASDNFSYKR